MKTQQEVCDDIAKELERLNVEMKKDFDSKLKTKREKSTRTSRIPKRNPNLMLTNEAGKLENSEQLKGSWLLFISASRIAHIFVETR
ncbi:unnamed protein product [Haemonchus placei]|uniref:Transposase n=1 Tax=Haemonchus placei TaxID=6290 RepID=A0A0N4WGV5_HAEPC|nr:unnamed protein product [Haemonchus placei]